MLKRIFILLILSIFATGMVQANVKTIKTEVQSEIRPSYPFPDFLSTGPYVWYENAENQPLRGHMYRLATFTVDSSHRVYLEKVIFGIDGCCLEIVNYRELMITEADLITLFPQNRGKFGFKLLSWRSANSFIFTSYGGQYILTDIDTDNPKIAETTDDE